MKNKIGEDHFAYQEGHSRTTESSAPPSSSASGPGAAGTHRSPSPLPTATEGARSWSRHATDAQCKSVIFTYPEEKELIIAVS